MILLYFELEFNQKNSPEFVDSSSNFKGFIYETSKNMSKMPRQLETALRWRDPVL